MYASTFFYSFLAKTNKAQIKFCRMRIQGHKRALPPPYNFFSKEGERKGQKLNTEK